MSERRKRLVLTVAGVFLLCLIGYVAGVFFLKEDTDNMRTYYKGFEGVWSGEDKEYRLEVHRVTSAHIVASIWYVKSNSESVLFSAVAEDENRYRFSLDEKPANAGDSSFLKKYGTISIQGQGIQLEMTNAEGGEIKYREKFTKREPLEETKQVSLESYMEGDMDVPADCTAYRDSNGKIWSVSVVLEKAEKENEYNLNGINRYCFETDCENVWGKNTESISLDSGYKKAVYEENGCFYTVIFDPFGLVSEIHCMKELEDSKREGDFLMHGDTVLRYLGYEKQGTEISLPEHTKKLAAGAFTANECIYQNSSTEAKKLTIPSNVEIESDAFRHCGKMNIRLSEGRKTIAEGAFAHLVPNDLFYYCSWVHVYLPESLEVIEKNAFNQDEGIVEWNDYLKGIADESSVSVVVENWDNVKEIKEGSLRGVLIKGGSFSRNRNLTYLCGDGVFYAGGEYGDFGIPKGVKELKKGAVRLIPYEEDIQRVYLPESLEKIEEEAIIPITQMPQMVADKKSKYFCNDELGWLYSKDKSELYSAVMKVESFFDVVGGDDGSGDILPQYHKLLSGDGYSRITIPDSVKNIHSYAFANMGAIAMWDKIRLPKNLEKMSRNAFCNLEYDIYLKGDVPEFYGDLSEATLDSFGIEEGATSHFIYVKKGKRKKFLNALLAGQEVTEEQRKAMEERIIGY